MTEFVDVSRHYRRGVVLGLSLAELFTVLVFLLLLVLGAYLLIQDETLAQKVSLVDDQRDVLVTLAGAGGDTIEPALPGDLQTMKSLDAIALMGEENRRLRDRLAERSPVTEPESEPDQSVHLIPVEEFTRQQHAIDDLTRTMSAMQERIRLLTDPAQEAEINQLEAQVAGLRRKNDALSRRLGATPNLGEALVEIDALRAGMENLEQENTNLRQDRELVDDLKGQDSPCWFRRATRPNGESYERPTYIFDIRISDQDILVQDVPAPTLEYQEQKTRLTFDRNGLNRHLTDEEFARAFAPLKSAAENREIRSDRRCTFYVAVWDTTSQTNKLRYKRAHNHVVQAVFNTYEYIHVLWPH